MTTAIKHWAKDDQPIRKLLDNGSENLSNAEILAILIRSGTKKRSALDIARELLAACDNNFSRLAYLSVEQLCAFDGIGESKAAHLRAAFELGIRKAATVLEKPVIIRSSIDAYAHLSPLVAQKQYEEFWIMMLRQNNAIIRSIRISEGGISGTVADPKRIFKAALDHNATSIILCHNHPSGNLKPSSTDLRLTQKLVQASNLLDIQVMDHLIITSTAYYSMADHGQV